MEKIMSEFNLEELDGVIAEADNSLVQMLALQLKKVLKERDALAVENAGLKSYIRDECYVTPPNSGPMAEADTAAEDYMPETPATDAAIANIRASEAKEIYESILDNPAVTDMGSLVDWIESYANNSISHASQLRKESANEQ